MWNGYPKIPLLPSQYWYYMIELGFYMSKLFTAALDWDVKRKDFKQMQVHHISTIFLITFSWVVNYIRAGTLIMLLNDIADPMFELAKMLVYSGWKRTSYVIFVIFVSTFVFTRLVIFPFWILRMTLVYPLILYPLYVGYFFFNSLLVLLMVLNIYWSYHLVVVAKRILSESNIEEKKDDEDADTESDDADHD